MSHSRSRIPSIALLAGPIGYNGEKGNSGLPGTFIILNDIHINVKLIGLPGERGQDGYQGEKGVAGAFFYFYCRLSAHIY